MNKKTSTLGTRLKQRTAHLMAGHATKAWTSKEVATQLGCAEGSARGALRYLTREGYAEKVGTNGSHYYAYKISPAGWQAVAHERAEDVPWMASTDQLTVADHPAVSNPSAGRVVGYEPKFQGAEVRVQEAVQGTNLATSVESLNDKVDGLATLVHDLLEGQQQEPGRATPARDLRPVVEVSTLPGGAVLITAPMWRKLLDAVPAALVQFKSETGQVA